MKENEEKFEKSAMNRKFVFPRKADISVKDPNFTNHVYGKNHSNEPTPKSHRRFKSLENRYIGNIVLADSNPRRSQNKNLNILEQTIQINGMNKRPKMKFNINQHILKKNLKKAQRNMNKSRRSGQENNSTSGISRKDIDGLRIGNTYDHRRKLVLNQDVSHGFTINDPISPNDSSLDFKKPGHSRKLNKTPINRYVKINTKTSATGLSKLYQKHVPLNLFSGQESENSSKKKFYINQSMDKTTDSSRAKTKLPTPRLFCIPSNNSILNPSFKHSHR